MDHLLLKATRGVTIALVSSRERKRQQPGLATDDPAFVGWHQLVRGIQGSQVHFDFVCGASENGRAAAGTEKPPGVVACFAIDRHRILREHRGSVKKGPMMLAAVETVTKADPVWESRRHNSNVAAKATAGESVHAASPLKSSGRNVYNEHRRASCRNRDRVRSRLPLEGLRHQQKENERAQRTCPNLQHEAVAAREEPRRPAGARCEISQPLSPERHTVTAGVG